MLPTTMVITDSASGLKKNISLQAPLKLYVCGITPYDNPHLGHGRCYVTFDLLVRLIQAAGGSVTYVRNFTDVDDKLIAKAERTLNDPARYPEVAQQYIDQFHADMQALNTLAPTHEPRVTQMIPQIIDFIKDIIASGHAYVVGADVYFRVRSYPGYGQLSGRTLDSMRAGARVEPHPDKEDPFDFALWKAEAPGTFFQSPWGWGRPGWHIECSAMARTLLGHTIDIHGGGLDLLFPHHENERAQTQVTQAEPFVHTWMHNAFVQVNKEKMSKSLGNFFTLKDIYATHTPQVVRYYFLLHQYRNPMDFDPALLAQARTSLGRLIQALSPSTIPSFDKLPGFAPLRQAQGERYAGHGGEHPISIAHPELVEGWQKLTPRTTTILQELLAPLYDDLNTPAFWGVLHTHLAEIRADDTLRAYVVGILRDILGLTLEPVDVQVAITPEIAELIRLRDVARAAKHYAESDRLRDELKKLGYEPKDGKQG